MARRPGPQGFTLVEVLVAVLLSLAVIRGAWSVLAAQRRAAVHTADAARVLESTRIVVGVLERELRPGLRGRDWVATGSDSVAVRSYRGLAIVCSVDGASTGLVDVSYRGWRVPNPAKDSALVLTETGEWRPSEILAGGLRPDVSCPLADGGEGRWLRLAPLPEGAVLVRVFQRGSYHLSGGAFRYRAGLGGRQPLTPELLSDAGTSLSADARGLLVELRYRDAVARGAAGAVGYRVWALDP